jgi:oxygen-independent coproporphyrinogen III oxidase
MHVYIHVPFCARRCSYCDFAISVRKVVPSEAFVAAVAREWTQWQEEPVWDGSPVVDTIYLGGGTPSLITPGAVSQLLDRIAGHRPVAPLAEITIEANPDDVTREAARAWKTAGVNRISLGAQSFHPHVLEWMHRTHTADQVPAAVETLRSAGFENLSIDLIFALPAALRRGWEADLEQAFRLQPEHLSLYGLTVEPHTVLAHRIGRGEVVQSDEETYAREFLTAHQALTAAGYRHYEVSNAARPGREARHNAAYWRRSPFIGLGPSAHSGFGNERRWNLREWAGYERALLAGCRPAAGREVLDERAIQLEEVYLGLRTIEGLPAHKIPATRRQEWAGAGWAVTQEDTVRLTPDGWLRLDALVRSVSP